MPLGSSVARLVLPSLALLLGIPARADDGGGPYGQVYLANRIGTEVDAPVSDCNGAKLLGPQFLAQLYVGPLDASTLTAEDAPTTFRTLCLAAGYFNSTAPIVRSVVANNAAQMQVRAWAADSGATYEEAVANGGRAGQSNTFILTPAGAPAIPPNLTALMGFALVDYAFTDGGCRLPAVQSGTCGSDGGTGGGAGAGGGSAGGGEAGGEAGGAGGGAPSSGCGCHTFGTGAAFAALGALLRRKGRRQTS